MRGRSFAAWLSAMMWVGLASIPTAQTPAGATGGGAVPRTADGRPDLQGVWDFRTITPLERPRELSERDVLTNVEAAELEAQTAARRVDQAPRAGDPGTYNQFWFDYGTKVVSNKRTSLIVDPPDGRLPPLTPAAQEMAKQAGQRPVRFRVGGIGTDGSEDRGLAERCLRGFNAGPPMLPSGYNNNVQLFQTPDYVVILNEMIHDARIVPLDGRPHLPPHLRQWMGDSRGRWEGDTLVIDTTNFTGKTAAFDPTVTRAVGSGDTLHLIERLTRLDAETLLYEFTIDDPATFTRPFTAAIPMTPSDGPIFEYACHEGNYGLMNILRGARAEDGAAGEAGRRD
jgi:hypothetical protein